MNITAIKKNVQKTSFKISKMDCPSEEQIIRMKLDGLQAGMDLRAKNIIPLHHSQFSLSKHSWDEPLQRITFANEKLENPQQVSTPKIGEVVFLNDTVQRFTKWWEGIECKRQKNSL